MMLLPVLCLFLQGKKPRNLLCKVFFVIVTNEFRAVPEYCWLSRLGSGMAKKKRGLSVFPMDLKTVLGNALRLFRVLLALPIGLKNSLELRHIGFPNHSSNRTRRRPENCSKPFKLKVLGPLAPKTRNPTTTDPTPHSWESWPSEFGRAGIAIFKSGKHTNSLTTMPGWLGNSPDPLQSNEIENLGNAILETKS